MSEATMILVVLMIDWLSKVFPASGSTNEPMEVLGTIELRVAEGEFASLIGPSGCGKSTLINLEAGIIDVYEGRVLIDGGRSPASTRTSA